MNNIINNALSSLNNLADTVTKNPLTASVVTGSGLTLSFFEQATVVFQCGAGFFAFVVGGIGFVRLFTKKETE